MTEHPYRPQPWRLTEFYPEAYARFMDILNDGIILDWNDDDHDRHEAEFLADLAAHDTELREQIAADLFLSPHTVKTHANRAMMKVGARDRAQLVSYAVLAGIRPSPRRAGRPVTAARPCTGSR